MRRIDPRVPAVLTLLLAGCGPASGGGRVARAPSGGERCMIREVERRYLEPGGGTQLYVEPSTMGTIDDGFFVAGHPTYTWSVDGSGRATRASERPFLGAIVRGDEVALLPLPPGVRYVGDVRSVPTPSGSYAFLIEEVDRAEITDQVPLRVVYAEYDDGRWSRVEELPHPPRGRLDLASAGAPVVQGGRLHWAVPYRLPEGGIDVLHFEREANGWRSSIAVHDWVDEVAMAPDTGAAAMLVLGGLDPDFGARLASLRIHRLDGSWSAARRIHPGRPGDRFRAPSFVSVSGAADVAWLRVNDETGLSEAWVATGVGTPDEGVPERFDARAVLLRTVGAEVGSAHAVTLHVDPTLGTEELHVYLREPVGYRLVASMPYPFQGPFAALATPSGDLLVIGPEAVRHTVTPFVRSLVIRLSPCT